MGGVLEEARRDRTRTGITRDSWAIRTQLTQRVQVSLWYIQKPKSKDLGAPIRPKYRPYECMDPLGKDLFRSFEAK